MQDVKDKEIEELKKTIERQQKLIVTLQQQVTLLQRQSRRRWEDDNDYLPYHDYEERS